MPPDCADTIPRDASVRAAPPEDSLWTLARAWLAFGVHAILVWHQRSRQRRQLLDLDERMLKDIGLTRDDVDAEIRKPFWRD